MKNLLVLLFTTVLFISCKDSSTPTDPIIGTWKLEKKYYVYSGGVQKEDTLSDCNKRIRYTYNADGTLEYQLFLFDKDGTCKETAKDFWVGNWKQINEYQYQLNHTRTFPTGEVSKSTDSTELYEFSKDYNTLTVRRNYEKAGIALHPNSKMLGELVVRKRIQ